MDNGNVMISPTAPEAEAEQQYCSIQYRPTTLAANGLMTMLPQTQYYATHSWAAEGHSNRAGDPGWPKKKAREAQARYHNALSSI